MSASKKLRSLVVPTKGRYALNQKVSVFADRRTHRNRSRSAKKRSAIQDSQEES